jgi:RNA polymerase sigma factor (sigma-70 family)
LTEKELIEGCLKGRKKAQDELYRIYAGRLFGICMRYTRNRMEAEDVLQEGFIKIFKKINTYHQDEDHSLYPWMRRVMVNTMLNWLRDHKQYRFTEDVKLYEDQYPDDSPGTCLSDLFKTISPEEILKAINELPDGYRAVFNLYAFEEYGHKEIADALGISVNTSKTQLMKARRAIIIKLNKIILKEMDIKMVAQ